MKLDLLKKLISEEVIRQKYSNILIKETEITKPNPRSPIRTKAAPQEVEPLAPDAPIPPGLKRQMELDDLNNDPGGFDSMFPGSQGEETTAGFGNAKGKSAEQLKREIEDMQRIILQYKKQISIMQQQPQKQNPQHDVPDQYKQDPGTTQR
jgi:hypothetical protein